MDQQQRRRLATAAAVVVAIALAAGGAVLVSRAQTPPRAAASASLQSRQLADQPVPGGPARPLVYAEGRRIHLGDRVIRTGQDLLSLDVTDDGVAFTTIDGLVWFTDGGTPQQIGATSPGRATSRGTDWGPPGRPNQWVVSDNSGSLLAWFEYPAHDRPEIVVFDTHAMRQVARVPIARDPACTNCAQILSVRDGYVYWTEAPWDGGEPGGPIQSALAPFRYRLSDGARTRVSASAYRDDLRHQVRMLVFGTTPDSGTLSDGIFQEFTMLGHRLVATAHGGTSTFVAATGRPVRLQAPPGFGHGFGLTASLRVFEWLDDDRIALIDTSGWKIGIYRGEDLLVCRLSTGRCTVAVRRSAASGSPIVPEFDTPGSDLAERRALQGQAALGGR